MSNDSFENADIISCYSWQDAVDDGQFKNISGIAQKWGFTIPVAVTSNLFHKHLTAETDVQTDKNIIALLLTLQKQIKEDKGNDSFMSFEHNDIKLFAKVEGRHPSNPEPVMTILLPEDY